MRKNLRHLRHLWIAFSVACFSIQRKKQKNIRRWRRWRRWNLDFKREANVSWPSLKFSQKQVSLSAWAFWVIPFCPFPNWNCERSNKHERFNWGTAWEKICVMCDICGLPFRAHALVSKEKNRKISTDDADGADEILILSGSLMFHGHPRNSSKSRSA